MRGGENCFCESAPGNGKAESRELWVTIGLMTGDTASGKRGGWSEVSPEVRFRGSTPGCFWKSVQGAENKWFAGFQKWECGRC